MNLLTIAEAKQNYGRVIPGVSGLIQKVKDVRTMNGPKGEWQDQQIEISDETGIIWVQISPPPKEPLTEDAVGQLYSFISSNFDGKTLGVKPETRDSNGKTYNTIKVSTKTAKIIKGTPGEAFKAKDRADVIPNPTKQVNSEPPPLVNVESDIERRDRYVALYLNAVEDALKVTKSNKPGAAGLDIANVAGHFFKLYEKNGVKPVSEIDEAF